MLALAPPVPGLSDHGQDHGWPVTVDPPKLRGTDEAYPSRLLGVGACRTNALESLVIAGFVRGESVRDVEASLAAAPGAEETTTTA